MKESIHTLLVLEESPVLEFKRQWYWDNDTSSEEMADKWGELIKDIISLANGYIGYVGKIRHLIIGFCEDSNKAFDINLKNIKQLQNLNTFKKDLLRRLEKTTIPALIDFTIETQEYEGLTLLIFEIPAKGHITELKSELKTKTRHFDQGGVFIRKGQNTDEVRVAGAQEYTILKEEFELYRKSEAYQIASRPEPETTQNERSIKKTVQLYMNKNSSISFVDAPTTVKNWKENIIYEIYRLSDSFGGKTEFIYIHDSANQGKTFGDIQKSGLISNIQKSIILIDRPNLKDVERRKENISKLFKTEYVYFVDEFGSNFLYKDCMLPYEKFNLPIYVNGLYDLDGQADLPALDRLKEWYYAEHDPLFIVSGHGGIGKTTLAKQFLDQIYSSNDGAGILFIDSKEIIHDLSRNSTINDVFDFYRAQMNVKDNDISRFNKDLLKLSIDNGSLTVVLDGIDEVIAKLGDRFDVKTFITSIFKEYSSDLHRTKVLITCRDYFWNEIGQKILLPEIVLKAFNSNLAEDFFNQKLEGDRKKITSAMAIAEQFAIEQKGGAEQEELSYIPFLLDMIGYLIINKNETLSLVKPITSSYLSQEKHSDFLILQVCDREIIKLGGLGVDQQVELFIRIAISKGNGVSIYDIKEALIKITGHFDNSLLEKVKGHSLLAYSGNLIHFRYDVFDVYFSALYLSDFFLKQDIGKFTDDTARIIAGYLKYESSFTDLVCERLEPTDDLVLFCLEIIETASNFERFEMLKSSIVSMLLCLIHKSDNGQSNLHTRTEILEKLFLNNDQIDGLALVDIFGNTPIKPTFDFRNRNFINCTFDNYEYFWECQMNEHTRFDKSSFKGINPRPGITIKVWENLFSEACDLSQVQNLLNKNKADETESKESVLTELLKIFRLFQERGNFYPRKQEEVRKKLSSLSLLPYLLEKGIIKTYKDPKKPKLRQFKVSDEYKSIIDYIDQGSPSIELFRLVEELS